MLPAVTATRYVTPLREGGSLPGLMEADDLGTYVVKFTRRRPGREGAGRRGRSAASWPARSALPVPELVTVDVDPVLAVGEPDQEVQELLRDSARASTSASTSCPARWTSTPARPRWTPSWPAGCCGSTRSIGNVDRSWRNPNMLFWHGRL